jgi:anti-sigma factor RsiW
MNCVESRLFLHAHADGELDIANSLELERHLKTCAACVAEEKSVRSLKAALQQSSLRYRAPDSLRKEIRQMARASGSETRPRPFLSLRLWKWLAFSATAVAMLTILWRSGTSERDQVLNEAVASHVRSLMAEHLTDVASSDQHTVKPWFNGKLDFAPDVKDFAAEGFALVGGRLDYLNGRPVAALVYGHNKHFINGFVWPTGSTSRRKAALEHRRGYSVINLERNGLHYCFVSDLNEKEMAELSNLFER